MHSETPGASSARGEAASRKTALVASLTIVVLGSLCPILHAGVPALNGRRSAVTATACATFAPAVNYAVGEYPYSVAAADFNGDGRSDIAVSNIDSNSVSILLATATGTFGPAASFAVGSSPQSMTTGDVNGDGNIDLVAANFGSGSNNVSILLGTGTGSFGAATDFPVGTNPSAVAVGDFNGDGNPDLAVTTRLSNVAILLGTGTGSFGAPSNFPVGGFPVSVAIGDFNGDGKSDLAIASRSVGISILLGTGTGSFGAATVFTAGTSPSSVAIGDFNADGHSDLAVANASSNNVSVLLGTGTGAFGAATNYAAGTSPSSVVIGDFNGDGKSDLAVANASSNNVSVLLGTGTGTFGAATNSAVGADPASLASGDFNGDGNTDLVTANAEANSVSVLLNSSAPGAFAFSSATYAVNEAGGTATITVNRSSGSDCQVTVAYATSNGTAQAGSDYVFTSGTLTFGAGVTTQSFTVPISDDLSFEGDETFTITISTPTGGASLGAPASAVVTIVDNDVQKPAPIPALGGWATILLAVSMALSGLVVMRNR